MSRFLTKIKEIFLDKKLFNRLSSAIGAVAFATVAIAVAIAIGVVVAVSVDGVSASIIGVGAIGAAGAAIDNREFVLSFIVKFSGEIRNLFVIPSLFKNVDFLSTKWKNRFRFSLFTKLLPADRREEIVGDLFEKAYLLKADGKPAYQIHWIIIKEKIGILGALLIKFFREKLPMRQQIDGD